MIELVPVFAGVLLGFGSRRWRIALRGLPLLVAGLFAGVVSSFVTGELSRSWVYAAVDSFQVVTICLLTEFLCSRFGASKYRTSI